MLYMRLVISLQNPSPMPKGKESLHRVRRAAKLLLVKPKPLVNCTLLRFSARRKAVNDLIRRWKNAAMSGRFLIVTVSCIRTGPAAAKIIRLKRCVIAKLDTRTQVQVFRTLLHKPAGYGYIQGTLMGALPSTTCTVASKYHFQRLVRLNFLLR